jgi:hypothetical protein
MASMKLYWFPGVGRADAQPEASSIAMAGVDPRTIMALGGWSNMGMLARYSHLTPGHLQAAVEKLVPTPVTLPELAQN